MELLEETTDYDVFKTHTSNRKLDEKHILELMEAIQEKNLLKTERITVDKDFYIIDGQHRIEACKRLKIPVPFVVSEDISKKDMITLNTHSKPWSIVDYLNYYVSEKYPEYEILQMFVEDEKLQLNIALQLLNGTKTRSFFIDFKEGRYKFPTNEEYHEVQNKKQHIKLVIEFIKKKTSGVRTYLDRVTFYAALIDFFNVKSFEFDVFMTKLEYKIDMVHPCTRQCEYVNLFKNIYNWKNKNRLEFDEE